jgi:hypothetical protein
MDSTRAIQKLQLERLVVLPLLKLPDALSLVQYSYVRCQPWILFSLCGLATALASKGLGNMSQFRAGVAVQATQRILLLANCPMA